MAYDRLEELSNVVRAIEENKLTFFYEVESFVAPALSTLYDWKVEESEEVKKALRLNKVNTKRKMRNRWQESGNATLELAAYKLIANAEELERLTINNNNNKQSGELNLNGGVNLIFEKAQPAE